jgi:hypothetical protein
MRVSELKFMRSKPFEDDVMHRAYAYLPTKYGIKRTCITVLKRLTGFGYWDIETGFRDVDGQFWLASGDFDIREYPDISVDEAIKKIKENSNNCRGGYIKTSFHVNRQAAV